VGLMTIFKFAAVKCYVSEHGAFSLSLSLSLCLSLEWKDVSLNRNTTGVLSGL
jgi:hypothetical protein